MAGGWSHSVDDAFESCQSTSHSLPRVALDSSNTVVMKHAKPSESRFLAKDSVGWLPSSEDSASSEHSLFLAYRLGSLPVYVAYTV